MKLTEVIEVLVEERGLDREMVIDAVVDGVRMAYSKKFPELDITVRYNKRTGEPQVCAVKTVVTTVQDEDDEITLRKARVIEPKIALGEFLEVPLEEVVGRIEILAAKQIISTKIRELEAQAVAEEFKEKEGTIVTGTTHKRERGGMAIKVGDAMALLPRSNSIPEEQLRVGIPVRCLLKEVLDMPRGGYQLILDRASSDFVRKLLELEIPEVFEGIVELQKIVRVPGYKTKVVVASNRSEVDPVGTCVGVGGVRIKPILKELDGEKIDLIAETESLETLIRHSLKPAEIDKVEVTGGEKAMVWLAQDQRSLAIGRMGRNIALASELTGINIQLQEAHSVAAEGLSFGDTQTTDEPVEQPSPSAKASSDAKAMDDTSDDEEPVEQDEQS